MFLLCRNKKRAEKAKLKLEKDIHTLQKKQIEIGIVDLGDLSSISCFCASFRKLGLAISVLINNAGAIVTDAMRVNHLGHMALCIGLRSCLIAGRARIVNVASCAHWSANGASSLASVGMNQHVSKWDAYCNSKAGNVLFTMALQRRIGRHGVDVVAYHPGVMLSDLWRGERESESTVQGRQLAAGLCCLCVKHPLVSGAGVAAIADPRCGHSESFCCGSGGGYFQQMLCCCVVPVRARPDMYSLVAQDELWDKSWQSIRTTMKPSDLRCLMISSEDSSDVDGDGGCAQKKDDDEGITNLDQVMLFEPTDERVLCSPALPCTEPCSLLPMFCVCVSCLC